MAQCPATSCPPTPPLLSVWQRLQSSWSAVCVCPSPSGGCGGSHGVPVATAPSVTGPSTHTHNDPPQSRQYSVLVLPLQQCTYQAMVCTNLHKVQSAKTVKCQGLCVSLAVHAMELAAAPSAVQCLQPWPHLSHAMLLSAHDCVCMHTQLSKRKECLCEKKGNVQSAQFNQYSYRSTVWAAP